MKRIITTIALALFMLTITNAQIKKPNISVNTTTVKTDKLRQGLKINNLTSLKSIEDFKKLKIPVQQQTKEKLNAKPTRTWKISATQLSYASLKLDYFQGYLSNNEFIMKGKSRIDNEPGIIDSRRRRGNFNLSGFSMFPLGIKFRTSGGVEYKLKINDLRPFRRGDIFVVLNDSFISRISKSNHGDYYYYVFKTEKAENITLKFSSRIVRDTRTRDVWGHIIFDEIIIERGHSN